MPNFKSISFKTPVLQGGGQNLPSPCVCYPKDLMWNRVKIAGSNPTDGVYICNFIENLDGHSKVLLLLGREGGGGNCSSLR